MAPCSLLRFWPAAQSGGQRLGWVTREAGIYRLEAALAWPVANEAGDAASAPVWRLLASGPVRRAPASAGDEAGQPPASPRLRALQADLARTRSPGRKKRLLREFWQAVQAQGAPLLEESRRRKARSPRCAACRARMSGHLSLPLPRGLRMACQLVIDPVQWPASGPHTRLQQVLAAGLSVQLDPLNPRAWHAGSADAAPAALP